MEEDLVVDQVIHHLLAIQDLVHPQDQVILVQPQDPHHHTGLRMGYTPIVLTKIPQPDIMLTIRMEKLISLCTLTTSRQVIIIKMGITQLHS